MQNDRLCSHLSAQWFHLIFKLDIIVNSWSCSWLISPRTEYAAFLDFDPHRTYFETIQGSFSLNELQSSEFQLKDFTAPYFIWWGYSLSELWLVYVVCHVCWNANDLHRRENNRREQTHCLYNVYWFLYVVVRVRLVEIPKADRDTIARDFSKCIESCVNI